MVEGAPRRGDPRERRRRAGGPLERDGFRDLYAQPIDPQRGAPEGEPFLVRHLHDPRRLWGSTPFGTAIVSNAFVFNQCELTGRIWLMDPGDAK